MDDGEDSECQCARWGIAICQKRQRGFFLSFVDGLITLHWDLRQGGRLRGRLRPKAP